MTLNITNLIGFGSADQLHPYTQNYINAMTTKPTYSHQVNIDNLVRGLIKYGIWSRMEYFCLFNSETDQAARLNLIDPTRSLSKIGSPTFTANVGFTNAASQSLVTPDNMTTWSNFSRDDNHIGIWPVTNVVTNAQDCSEYQSGAYLYDIISYTTNSSYGFYGRNFTANSGTFKASGTTDVTTSIGHSLMTRASSADYDLYKNGTKLTGGNTATAIAATRSVPAVPYVILQGYNTYSGRQYRLWHCGRSLTATQINNLYNLLVAYAAGI